MEMNRYVVRKVTANKGHPRVFLDIPSMEAAGFEPGKTYVRKMNEEEKRIVLIAQPNGTHVVCKKEQNGKTIPVIDINSTAALSMFDGIEAVRIVIGTDRIVITPMASETKRVQRLERMKEHLAAGQVTTAGVSFGAGILDHAAHAGLEEAGIHATLAMANEIDESLLNHATEHNDIWNAKTIGIAAPMQELVQDEAAMSRLGKVDVLALGIPCSGASRAGKSSRKISMMESHPHVGHLVASALMIVNRIQPGVIVIENVPDYANSASAEILRSHLRDSAYVVNEVVLDASEFGSLEKRVRWFMIAATRGIEVDLSDLAPTIRPVRSIGDILEPIGPDAPDWRTFDYLKSKEVRDKEKGNGFMMQTISPSSTSCATLRRGYAKAGSTDALLVHPSDPTLLRQLTVTEHARIKGVPEPLLNGMSKTDGHAALGQSVDYRVVRTLFKRIGECLLHWKDMMNPRGRQAIGYDLVRATG